MAANTNPISPIAPAFGAPFNTALVAAETSLKALTNAALFFTAGANGAKVPRVRVWHLGTNVATVMRIFYNNGGAIGTEGSNTLLAEETIASNTLSQVAKSVVVDIYLGLVMKPTHRLYYTIGTAVAAGHGVSAPDAGDY
jgi:hypothetical protein